MLPLLLYLFYAITNMLVIKECSIFVQCYLLCSLFNRALLVKVVLLVLLVQE